jgi:iduronate 2-sulfatase
VKDAAFTQVQNGLSVRTDRWRYTEWDEGRDGAVLYDMDKDPRETTNLADDPAHAATVATLKARLAAYRR